MTAMTLIVLASAAAAVFATGMIAGYSMGASRTRDEQLAGDDSWYEEVAGTIPAPPPPPPPAAIPATTIIAAVDDGLGFEEGPVSRRYELDAHGSALWASELTAGLQEWRRRLTSQQNTEVTW